MWADRREQESAEQASGVKGSQGQILGSTASPSAWSTGAMGWYAEQVLPRIINIACGKGPGV